MIEFDGFTLVNCTNKVLPIATIGSLNDYVAFSPDGTICTLKSKVTPKTAEYKKATIPYGDEEKLLCISFDTLEERQVVIDLPPKVDGTIYVVTRQVALIISKDYPDRDDFVYPSISTGRRLVINNGGAVTAYDTFIHIASYPKFSARK